MNYGKICVRLLIKSNHNQDLMSGCNAGNVFYRFQRFKNLLLALIADPPAEPARRKSGIALRAMAIGKRLGQHRTVVG